MKVFLSWSGELSQQVAVAMSAWLPSVIQVIETFVSSDDIDKGTRWNMIIGRELEATSVGVICVTRENLGSVWLNFEAGSLSKSLDDSRVMPFLFGMKKSEVFGPLAQFQMTAFARDEMGRLVASINRATVPPALEEGVLVRAFDRWWPDLEQTLAPLLADAERLTATIPDRERVDQGAVLEEVLELVRSQQRTLTDLHAVRNMMVHDSGRRESREATDDLRARWAAVAATARGLTDADGRSYRALFEYLEPGVVRVLREDDEGRSAASAFRHRAPGEEQEMSQGPAYRVLARPIGNDIVALDEFGGGHGDPVAAWVRVDGQVVLQVVAPALRAVWESATEERFRDATRRLAATHDLLNRNGAVTVLFDPPPTSADDSPVPSGEPVERM